MDTGKLDPGKLDPHNDSRPGDRHGSHTSHARAHPEHDHPDHDHPDHGHLGHGHLGHGHPDNDHAHHDHAQGHARHAQAPHGHHHAPHSHDKAFAIGAGVNLGFALIEIGFGFAANSVALIADAVHNLGDVLTLLLGWMAVWLHRRPPSGRRTYGWGRFSILAALGNAALLLISVGAIGIEALHRLHTPAPVATITVMLVAAIGILVNGGSALMFLGGRHGDLNIRAQYLHLATDAVVSLGVVLAALAMRLTGWNWLDPLTSLAISCVIAHATWTVVREAADLAMDAVPAGVSQPAVRDWLMALPGVTEVHDLHIWALSTTETALTAHLVYADAREDRRPHDLATELRRRFGIGHATVQIESDADAALCRLRPNDVV